MHNPDLNKKIRTRVLDGATHHQFLDLANCLGRVQALRTHVYTVHDGVAAEQTVWVFQVVQTLTRGLITAVGNETVSLQQTGRAYELVRVPPERWAAG